MMTTIQMLEQLSKLPKKIEEQNKMIIESMLSLDEAEIIIKKIKSEVLHDVCEEKDDKGKLKYTNDNQRQWQMEQILGRNMEYKRLVDKAKLLRKDIDSMKIELEFLRDSFLSIRSIVKILKGE